MLWAGTTQRCMLGEVRATEDHYCKGLSHKVNIISLTEK